MAGMNITLLNVVKRYGDKVALELPALELVRGQVTAVLGESGAGKTTLLSVLAGTIPYEGKAAGTGAISYLFQSAKLLPHLTAEKNLRLVLPKKRWGEIAPMLERVGLKERARSLPRDLSGGERQRVALARAVLFPHETLLLDEPFASLDLSLKRSLLALFSELIAERGETAVFVTHDPREAALLSHRALVLRKGKIVADFENPAPFPRDFLFPPPLEGELTRALLSD